MIAPPLAMMRMRPLVVAPRRPPLPPSAICESEMSVTVGFFESLGYPTTPPAGAVHLYDVCVGTCAALGVGPCAPAADPCADGDLSFMAGVIASHDDCRGFAPDASLYFVRVFDSSQAPRRYPPLCPALLSRAAPCRRRRRRRHLRRRSAWPPPPLPGPAAATIAATISC